MAASGSAISDKTVDFGSDSGEVEVSYTCEHGTVHRRRFPSKFEALMTEIRERDKDLTKMESGRKAPSKPNRSSINSLNRSHSLPLRRLSSRKRFVVPRKDMIETNDATPKAGTSNSGLDKHDALMSEIRQHGILREKGLLKMKTTSKADKSSSDKEKCLKNYYDCLLIGGRPRDHDPISSEDDSTTDEDEWFDSESDNGKLTNKSGAARQNREEINPYEEALLRSLILFNDLDLNDELDDEIFMNLDVLGLDNNRLRNVKNRAAPNYPCGPEITDECLVCLEKMKLRKRLCCDFAVCDDCMEKYLTYEVERGVVKIECINGTCDSYVHRDEILERLPFEIKDKYYRFLVDANKDPNVKTCPRCSKIYNRTENGVIQNYGKYGVKVECPDCKLDWCFECQAPWHANIKCKDFRKGDDLLKLWAREQHFGHLNAQRCPRCKIFIERKGGCDHMVCTKCNTSFCYRCGDRFMDFKFFGNHLSRLSPLGCKYNYKPDEPVKRKLVRGSLLGAKLLGGVFLVGLGLAAGAVLVGASVIILPVLGGIKYHRYRKIRNRRKRHQKLFSLRTRRAMMESLREQAVMEYVTERYRTWPRQEQREGAVHIGIQTGPSQQVDVTVHNPYHPDGPRDNANLNSEIKMDIKDDLGHLTRTTAEIMPGGSHEDEGDVVLHVKTEYTDPPHSDLSQNSPDLVKDSEKEASFEASGKSSLSSRSSSAGSSRKSGGKSKTKTKRSRKYSGPQSEKKELKKLESDHSLKRKDLGQNNENGLSSALPDLGLSRSLNSSHGDDSKHLSDIEQTGPISHSETGCFLSLFKKPINPEKEKEKQSIPKLDLKENIKDIPKHDLKDKELQCCPDIVSCTLKTAGKVPDSENYLEKPEYSTQSSCSSSELDSSMSSDYYDHDPYLGMISTETYKTFL